MKNLNQSSAKPLVNRWFIIGLTFLAFVGFLVSGYLTAEYYLGELPTCTILHGCDEVAKSKYSMIGPFPLSLLGVGYFVSLLVLLVAYLDMKKESLFKFFMLLTIPGFITSVVLIWLQYSVIKAWCIYCLAADITTILIFFSATFLYATIIRTKSLK